MKTIKPGDLKYDDSSKPYFMDNGEKQYVVVKKSPTRETTSISDELIEYTSGMPGFTIKNDDPQISKILNNAINNPKIIKISQEVKVAQTENGHEVKNCMGRIQYKTQGTKDLEFIDVTPEIIQILSIVSHIRNNEPGTKFNHLDSNEYTFIGQSV